MNIGQNAARLERPNATRQPLTARITRCGPILAIRTEKQRHLGRATRRPSRRFCFSVDSQLAWQHALATRARRSRTRSRTPLLLSQKASVRTCPPLTLCSLVPSPKRRRAEHRDLTIAHDDTRHARSALRRAERQSGITRRVAWRPVTALDEPRAQSSRWLALGARVRAGSPVFGRAEPATRTERTRSTAVIASSHLAPVIAREIELLATRGGRLVAFDVEEIEAVAEHAAELLASSPPIVGQDRSAGPDMDLPGPLEPEWDAQACGAGSNSMSCGAGGVGSLQRPDNDHFLVCDDGRIREPGHGV